MPGKYGELRASVRSGDVLLCEGKGIISTLIRVLTAQQISHVALFVWINDALWVAEMKEMKGYRLVPASLWVEDFLKGNGNLYLGRAPQMIQDQPDTVKDTVHHYRNASYGYLSLIRVWVAQIFKWRRRTRQIVCSTFVARVWEACGYKFKVTPAPGEYLRLCQSVERITEV